MKFFILNTDYPDFLFWLYAQHPGLENQPYEEQMRVRMDSFFGTADFYSCNLRKLGHEAWDVIANIEPMQKQWAKENGIQFKDSGWKIRFRKGILPWPYRNDYRGWLYPILAAQIKQYRPDVLYSMAIETIGSEFLHRVRGYYRLAVMQHAAPLPAHGFAEYDLGLSSLPNQVDHFRKIGMNAELFRLGFEPKVLSSLIKHEKCFDIAFVGGIGGYHQRGTETLEKLCEQFNVVLWGYGIENVRARSALQESYHGSLWGAEMYQTLCDAKIVFNRHINVAQDYANNMRLYETTGVGSFLLTDHKRNLAEMFEPGQEVVAYRNPEECVELTRYYLEHKNEREVIARAGQQRTLREHTYYHRMEELIKIVQKYL